MEKYTEVIIDNYVVQIVQFQHNIKTLVCKWVLFEKVLMEVKEKPIFHFDLILSSEWDFSSVQDAVVNAVDYIMADKSRNANIR